MVDVAEVVWRVDLWGSVLWRIDCDCGFFIGEVLDRCDCLAGRGFALWGIEQIISRTNNHVAGTPRMRSCTSFGADLGIYARSYSGAFTDPFAGLHGTRP